MNLSQLKNFLHLAEKLNFRKTADNIFIAQPALSRQIKLLEDETQALLFKRNKRNVELTAAGKFFKSEAEKLINQFSKTLIKTGEIHRGEAGEIIIGHSTSSLQSVLLEIIFAIKKALPGIRTQLIELTNEYEIEALGKGRIDIGFAPNIIVPDWINSKIIYEENFVVILPAGHKVNRKNFKNIGVFAKEEFILPKKSSGIGYVESIEGICKDAGFTPNVTYESGNSASVLRLVESGLGISIEPKSILRGTQLNIKMIELKNIKQKVQTKVIWLKEREDELLNIINLICNRN